MKNIDITPNIYHSPLDGSTSTDPNIQNPNIIGVMIDNHPDARPQFGLSEAKIVYEAPVEGNFTRFLAIFDASQDVEKVGPVRSARPYYIDWLSEYGLNAIYMHCGGSPEALKQLKTANIINRDEYFWSSFYWRDKYNFAPHNLCTNNEKWQKIFAVSSTPSVWEGLKFITSTSATRNNYVPSTSGDIEIKYATTYLVTWKFNTSTGFYERWTDGLLFREADRNKILASNVIIQHTRIVVIDEVGRKHIQTFGSGQAEIYRSGSQVVGIWKKENLTGRTRFFDSNGDEINLVPGKTWIEVVAVD